MLFGRNEATAGRLDVWGWREMKVLPVAWFDGLARILTKIEEIGTWPEGLLDAEIAMIPKADGDATASWPASIECSPQLCTAFGHQPGWCSLKIGSSHGSLNQFSVLVVVGVLIVVS